MRPSDVPRKKGGRSIEFGQETVDILNEICAASRISSARSRHILDYLRDGGGGDKRTPQYEDHVNSKVRERLKRAEGKEPANAVAPRRRRKKADIEASGSYERDEYRPPKRRECSTEAAFSTSGISAPAKTQYTRSHT